MYKLSRAEQETVIRWDAEEKIAYIDAATPTTIRKLDKLAEELPEVYRCVSVDPRYNAKRYTVPMAYIRFGRPASAARRESGRRLAESRNSLETTDRP